MKLEIYATLLYFHIKKYKWSLTITGDTYDGAFVSENTITVYGHIL